MSRAGALLVGLLVAGLATAGCSLPAPGCDFVIAAADAADVVELPPDAEILVRSADVGPLGWAVVTDDSGNPAVDLRLGPDATERLAAHTRAHQRAFLAIAVNGVVVATPMIMRAIEDGQLRLTGVGADGGDLVEQLGPCLPVEVRPPA